MHLVSVLSQACPLDCSHDGVRSLRHAHRLCQHSSMADVQDWFELSMACSLG